MPAGTTDRIRRIENHDGALQVWRDHQVRDRVLLHLDAHHDLWWIPENGAVTIANFLCQALKERIAREIIWVVPDPTWKSSKGRDAVRRHIEKLSRTHPGSGRVTGSQNCVEATVSGRRIRACPFSALPPLRERVLLDIDVDFLIIPVVAYRQWDSHAGAPWCWPFELADRLSASGVRAEIVTIAYSVEGGYTPLRWKYLGDELAARLTGSDAAGFERMREASQCRDPLQAERLYREAAELLPDSAAPLFHLAHLCSAQGRLDEGRDLYRQAVKRDPSFRTPYNSSGLWHDWAARFTQAEQEHRAMLALAPDDPYAHYGLGRLAARRKRFSEAEAWLRGALAVDGRLIDAHRWLGDVLLEQDRAAEAAESYTRALRLLLDGHKPMAAPIAAAGQPHPFTDPTHWYLHARLARAKERAGSHAEAIRGYRMAIAAGWDGAGVRARLVRLHVLQGQWRHAVLQAWECAKQVLTLKGRII